MASSPAALVPENKDYFGLAIPEAQGGMGFGAVEAMDFKVMPAADLLTTAQTLARKMAVNSPPAVRMTKRLLREGQTASLANLLELSAAYQAIAHKTSEHAKIVNDFMEAKAARQAARK